MKTTFWAVVFVTCSLGCGGAATGDDDGSGNAGAGGAADRISGLPSSSQVTSLSSSKLAKLCDYMNAQLGGYGHKPSCDPNSMFVYADASQAACVNKVKGKTCSLTVGNVEDCADALHAAPCSLPLVCAPLWTCANS
jgi:hypothetical protein